jgi:peptide/nickel transport system substrate-binding protein
MKLVPWIATGYKLIDATTWVIPIRKGVRFHDGSPLKASDVKFSIERNQSPKSDFKGDIDFIKEVVVVDDYTIQIITKTPNPIFPNLMTNLFIMSESWCKKHNVVEPHERASGKETYASLHAMGTGPFKLVSRIPNVETILEKNQDWWALKDFPHEVDRVVYTPIHDSKARTEALLSGKIDFLLDPLPQDIQRIEETPGVKIEQTAQVRTIMLGLNQGAAELLTSNIKGLNPFADRRVRLAMYKAIDIEEIRTDVMHGHAIPAGLIQPPAVRGYTKKLDQRYPYDPVGAKQLLIDAGYPKGFSVRLDCPNNRYINDELMCRAVVDMMAKVDIRVTLSASPKMEHFKKLRTGATDFYMLGWGNQPLDSYMPLDLLIHANDSGWNGTGYNDPMMNTLIDDIGAEMDFLKRDVMIDKAWQKVVNDIVYLPLHHQVLTWAMSDRVHIPIEADNEPRFFLVRFNKK